MRLLVLVVLATSWAACGGVDRETGAVTEPAVISILDIEVGDCFDDPEDPGAVAEATVMPCDQAHDNEVFALPQYPADAGEPYPGDGVVDGFAEDACIEAFEAYVGLPYEESVFLYGSISPRAGTWEDGDREVVCVLYDPDLEKLQGSMRGSRR